MGSSSARLLAAVVVGFATLGLLAAPAALAQLERSRCADCHFANPYTEPAQEHLHRWSLSPHGRSDVGCDRCHGGDPGTFESQLAHIGVLGSFNPSSPIHRTQLPATCGSCHSGPYVNFQESRHYELLTEGDRRVPVCTTCHGSVGARLLSPRGLERQCAECHGPDGIEPREGRAEAARLLLQGVADVRESLQAARHLIERVRDENRRRELQESYLDAESPVIEARRAGHRFVFDRLEERLEAARERTADLLSELANPSP